MGGICKHITISFRFWTSKIRNKRENFVRQMDQKRSKRGWINLRDAGLLLLLNFKEGNFFEKAGVNTSKLSFPFNKSIANSMKERGTFEQVFFNSFKEEIIQTKKSLNMTFMQTE